MGYTYEVRSADEMQSMSFSLQFIADIVKNIRPTIKGKCSDLIKAINNYREENDPYGNKKNDIFDKYSILLKIYKEDVRPKLQRLNTATRKELASTNIDSVDQEIKLQKLILTRLKKFGLLTNKNGVERELLIKNPSWDKEYHISQLKKNRERLIFAMYYALNRKLFQE